MPRESITRDSDGATIDLAKEEAEHADTTANAKKVTIVDGIGTAIGSGNPLPVDTEISISGDVIVQDVDINDISAGTQTNDVKMTLNGESVVLGGTTDPTYIGDIKFGESLPTGSNTVGKVYITDGTDDATITDEGYLDVTTHSNHSGFSVAYSAAAINTTTGYVLIDLSDTTNYPHTNVDEIHIDWIILDYLADSLAAGSIEVGFIKSITADNADWYSLVKAHLDKKEEEKPIMLNFTPQCLRCAVVGHLSGGTMFHDDDTTFQNDTALTATYSTVAPAIGDLVAKVTLSAGSVSFVVTIGYHT